MLIDGISFNINNPELFKHSVDGIRRSISTPDSFYFADNVITWNRNFSFMHDENFMAIMKRHATNSVEMSIIWRTYILCHFAKLARRLPGDFIEVGAYKGNTAHVIADRIDLSSSGKHYWLYDTFDSAGAGDAHAMSEHGPELFDKVKQRFASYPFVQVIKGSVPESFDQGFPEQIAFAHVDLNQARPKWPPCSTSFPAWSLAACWFWMITAGGVTALKKKRKIPYWLLSDWMSWNCPPVKAW
jgi:hypothetical protein